METGAGQEREINVDEAGHPEENQEVGEVDRVTIAANEAIRSETRCYPTSVEFRHRKSLEALSSSQRLQKYSCVPFSSAPLAHFLNICI